MSATDPTRRFGIPDALELYGVPYWGKGYFGVNEKGHVTVHPTKDPKRAVDMKALVDELEVRGIYPPILLRFTDILAHRIGEIASAFDKAIRENNYRGAYRCVYPIKVNQQRHVVEEIRDLGAKHGFGLEAGSKPELLAVLAMTTGMNVPIICNGFKDDEFIEMVILAQKIGQEVIPVVEKMSELHLIVKHAEAHRVKPKFGIRVKLSARGSGKWELSGGLRSKFGLFVSEVLEALDFLKQRDMSDCLTLLHFHLGSQITNIRNVKNAVNELARVYVELAKEGAGLTMIDVGGGLGVDYDGSQTNFESSMNYTLEEYASDVVFRIMSVCDDAEVAHPTILSESGRAMVAYHSVLVFDVLGAARFDRFQEPKEVTELAVDGAEDVPAPLVDLFERVRDVNRRNVIEYYHDGLQAYEETMNLFNLGYVNIRQRASAEQLFWALCARVVKLAGDRDPPPEEVLGLKEFLADTYFCNFSVFQSLPDSWAIDQLFPIMPIHRLGEEPTRRGVLADITCDSDGKIDHFTHLREEKRFLELHSLNGKPYFLGAFLVGAYQEILGDMHNLLGDTHAVHVSLEDDGRVSVDHVVKGHTVRDVLSYVQISADELLNLMRKEVERAVKQEKLTLSESALLLKFYESGLSGYTYLEEYI